MPFSARWSPECHRVPIKGFGTLADGGRDGLGKQRGKSWYAYYDEYADGERQTNAKSFGRDKRAAQDIAALKNADRIR